MLQPGQNPAAPLRPPSGRSGHSRIPLPTPYGGLPRRNSQRSQIQFSLQAPSTPPACSTVPYPRPTQPLSAMPRPGSLAKVWRASSQLDARRACGRCLLATSPCGRDTGASPERRPFPAPRIHAYPLPGRVPQAALVLLAVGHQLAAAAPPAEPGSIPVAFEGSALLITYYSGAAEALLERGVVVPGAWQRVCTPGGGARGEAPAPRACMRGAQHAHGQRPNCISPCRHHAALGPIGRRLHLRLAVAGAQRHGAARLLEIDHQPLHPGLRRLRWLTQRAHGGPGGGRPARGRRRQGWGGSGRGAAGSD